MDHKPLKLAGVDNSKEMIEKLKMKFNDAEVFVSENNALKNFEDSSFDIIISTLTIGHIKNADEYFTEWNRVLKPKGEIVITDFHPEAFSAGMKRSFLINKEVIEVENYLYTLDYLTGMFTGLNWKIVSVKEKIIDDDVRHFFVKQNYINAFNKYKGTSLILGLHIVK
ncbi:MAG: class I SAM-dependent methyltransferase [Ignavibacteria bacterium]|nr:class I SAM-dependent methyltransferase [Ignavibacteria bacterium]